MQTVSATDLIAAFALLLGILNFLFGGGVLRSRFKSKPDIRITHWELSPADPSQEGRRYITLNIGNEREISVRNFNTEIKILGQMDKFESLPLNVLGTEVLKPRTTIFTTLGVLIAKERFWSISTTIRQHRLPLNQVHRFRVRFAYEGKIEDPRYEVVLNAEESNPSIEVNRLTG